MCKKIFSIQTKQKIFLSTTFLTFLDSVEKFCEEIIKNAKVDLGLCFTRFLGGKIHDFHVFRNFLTFGPKSEKIEISTKMCTFGSKSEKSAYFHENHQKEHFFALFAPLAKMLL